MSEFPITVSLDGYYITINSKGDLILSEKEPLKPGETAQTTEKYNYVDGTNYTTIPQGFTVSKISGETTIANGLVIYDIPNDVLEKLDWKSKNEDGTYKVQTDYNQFVWIPVNNETDIEFNRVFKRTQGYKNLKLHDMLKFCGEADETGLNSYLKNNGIEENSIIVDETRAMYASVKKYGGFYIGRYEAGKGTNLEAVSKKNASVYNNIGWSNSADMTVITGGAVEKSRNMKFSNNNINITPTLCYGVQWDATLDFIDCNFITNQSVEGIPKCSINSYLVDSIGKGWYSDNFNTGNANHKTGVDIDTEENNSQNNIYDMAGNVWEWTMESYGTNNRIYRGGSFAQIASDYPASGRGYSGNSSETSNTIGFRIALYL